MGTIDDLALLREYAARNSEAAFETLVSRRVNFVYSAALRQVRDPQLAAEITQAVFIILARKAWRISDRTILTGWLFKTTRFAARAELRNAALRRRREQEAQMQSEIPSPPPDPEWEQMSPLLDEALAALGETDRQAVLLRFFENKSLAEVGVHLGTGEDTARKRVARALEKLRRYFSKRGAASTTVVIAGMISANSVQAAPVALAKSATVMALTKGVAASGSTLTLIKGALKLMAWTKAKVAVVVGVGALLAAGATTVVVEKVSHSKLSETNLSWADNPKYWASDSRVLESLPTVMIIRPTQFPRGGGGVQQRNRIMYKNCSIPGLLDIAYGFGSTRTVFPENKPLDSYDVMYTLSAPFSPVLSQEVAKQFGYAARKESRVMDVLLLKVVNQNPPNLKASKKSASESMMSSGLDKTVIEGQNISTLCGHIEGILSQPVLDRTGLKGKYDVTLQMNLHNNRPSKE